MAELYHLFHMLFSALLFLISCLGSLGQFLYQWPIKTEHMQQKERIQPAGSRPLNGVFVDYPSDMRLEKKDGKVVLTCDVEITGKTSNCHVLQSSGEKSFDMEALRYVMRALYRPATKNNIPVKEYAHRYTITFKL